MINKKIIFLFFIFCYSKAYLFGQNEDNSSNIIREKIKAQKVAFITQSLDLTVIEAQAFWPVYNEFEKKSENINAEIKKILQTDRIDNMTDKEAESISDKYIENEMQLANLQKEYYTKLKTVLPPKKIVKFYASVKEFHRKLLKDLKDKQNKG